MGLHPAGALGLHTSHAASGARWNDAVTGGALFYVVVVDAALNLLAAAAHLSEAVAEVYADILDGNLDWMKTHPQELVRELYAKMRYQRLRPRVLVSYVREPYIYKAGNVRVTFDSAIRTSLYHQDFLTKTVSDISATDAPQDMILEVKYDAFLPEIIQDLVQVPGIRQQAFSKYGACRRFG